MRRLLKFVTYIGLAFSVSRCGVPASFSPLFVAAAVTGAGAALGAGSVQVGWENIISTLKPTPVPTPEASGDGRS